MIKFCKLGILIAIFVFSMVHIAKTHHICRLDADSWKHPESGIWPFSYIQGSEVGVSMDINSPEYLDAIYIPGEGYLPGQTPSRGRVSFLLGIYEDGIAIPGKVDGVENSDYRYGYYYRDVFHESRWGSEAEDLNPMSQGVITITNPGFEDHAPGLDDR